MIYAFIILFFLTQFQEQASIKTDPLHPDFHLLFDTDVIKDRSEIEKIYQEVGLSNSNELNFDIRHQTRSPYGHEMKIKTYTHHGKNYVSLSAYRKTNDKLMKEFEYVGAQSSTAKPPLEALKIQRDLWQKHSNENRPDLVVKNVYHQGAYYLNRGNLLNSQAEIIKEYQYMTSPGWSIELVEAGITRVSDDTTVEIGTFSNGNGQYLLIWKKLPNGKWVILLDFNF